MNFRQLILGIVCMIFVSNLQYAWTLFVLPIEDAHHWGLPAIQWGFTLFILTQTWLVPFEGYLVDRFGPRPLMIAGGVLVAASWIVNGYASTLTSLYAGQFLGGLGVGVVVSVAYGNALKWFKDRRGLAVGLTAAGYGIGSALTVIPISWMITQYGYGAAFLVFGLIQGVVLLIAAVFIRAPEIVSSEVGITHEAGYTLSETLRTPIFWVMYVMFVLVATGGLMATAQLAPIAHSYGVKDAPVSVLWLTLPALVFALSFDRIANGISRPLFGWISDMIGREKTMLMAFLLEAAGVFGLIELAQNPVAFVILSGVVFFGWGEIFSLFPSLSTDIFGRKFATLNYGALYTAKGVAALLVPFGSVIAASGHWDRVLAIVVAFDIIAAILAIGVLMPMRISFATKMRS